MERYVVREEAGWLAAFLLTWAVEAEDDDGGHFQIMSQTNCWNLFLVDIECHIYLHSANGSICCAIQLISELQCVDTIYSVFIPYRVSQNIYKF